MAKYIVFKKEFTGSSSYRKTEFETLDEIVANYEGDLKDIIITKEVKVKIVEDTTINN
jgi:hypothetical protein